MLCDLDQGFRSQSQIEFISFRSILVGKKLIAEGQSLLNVSRTEGNYGDARLLYVAGKEMQLTDFLIQTITI